MRPIVCATRGGEYSRRTQEKAIELARERGAPLIFLYVADPSFAGPLSEKLEAALADELQRLGQALLSIAENRAIKAGLEAKVDIRCCGAVQAAIAEYLQQVNASTLVIGAPRKASSSPVFDPSGMDKFAESLRETYRTEIVVVS